MTRDLTAELREVAREEQRAERYVEWKMRERKERTRRLQARERKFHRQRAVARGYC